ncbi:DUF996 domain-containing protein [Marinitoga arctica]
MEIKNAKILAGVGAILGITGQFAIIGIIMELIGVYKISLATKDKRIFNFMLWPLVLFYVIFVLFFLSAIRGFMYSTTSNFYFDGMESLGEAMASYPILFLITIVLMIFPAIFQIKAYNLIRDYFGNDNFDKAAKFLKWGLILSIVLVGFILIFVSKIFAIIGYFTLPDKFPENITDEERWKSY